MFEKQAPVVEKEEGSMEGDNYRHPAYGVISVIKGNTTQGGVELFGSNLKHKNVLTITLSTAYMKRSLSRDWVFSDDTVVSFQMSESQWASFVSSQGGVNIPVTFEQRPDESAPLRLMPGIESEENMTEVFDRETRERCEKYMETATQLEAKIREAMEGGKTTKGKLKELHDLAMTLSVGMPNTMAFMQNQMATAMEKTVSEGKIEIEAFVNDMAVRTGIEALRTESANLIDRPHQDDQDNN